MADTFEMDSPLLVKVLYSLSRQRAAQLACLRGVAVFVERADFQVLVLPVGEQGG